ncbi:hypothetical protein GCM10027514_16630 [Azotobacter armeniacus]
MTDTAPCPTNEQATGYAIRSSRSAAMRRPPRSNNMDLSPPWRSLAKAEIAVSGPGTALKGGPLMSYVANRRRR